MGKINRFTLFILLIWTAMVASSSWWNIHNANQQMMRQAYSEAQANLNKDITFRQWGTRHGGVYVPITDDQAPIEWMSHVEGQNITTTDGRQFTLINPASMLRQMMDDYSEKYGIVGRITGLKYLNPGNAPDLWEKEQLQIMAASEQQEVWSVSNIDGQPHLRYLRAMYMTKGCEKCHAILGYKEGDFRGATGLNLPLAPYYSRHLETRNNLIQTHFILWFVGTFALAVFAVRARKQEQKRLFIEKQLRQKHRAVEETPIGVIITDEKGIIVYTNPASLLIYGYSQLSQLVGKSITIFMLSDNSISLSEQLNEMKQKLSQGKGWDGEMEHYQKDGQRIWIRQHLTPIQDKGQVVKHFVSIHEDVTAFRLINLNLEKKVKQRTQELEHARDRAEAAANAKSIFLANMSHEIRTPMNAVIGFSELIVEDPNLSESTAKYIKTILSSAKALLGIINDVLDISKLESGKFGLENVCFHLPNLLKAVINTLEHQAKEKNLYLKLKIESTLALRYMGDPTRIRQVILNIVSNALKFTNTGGITISVSKDDELLHFSITDTGIGIAKEDLKRIFEPFAQADDSTSRRYGGTGLGISISKEIIDLHQGKLWGESRVDQGTTFHFTFRLTEASSSEGCLYEPSVISTHEYISPRQFRVLLAEDIEANAILAIRRLELQRHTVDHVTNGKHAVEEFKNNIYDLILMDVYMPGMDGLEATKAIREIERESEAVPIPIIALTASVMDEDKKMCIEAGMDYVAAKPVNFPELYQLMESLVEK